VDAPVDTEIKEPDSFRFEGDDEAYPFGDEQDSAKGEEAAVDVSKPFDPAIEALLKDNPEALKTLKSQHYELRNWKANGFKNPAELKAFKSRVEALGGPDKIEAESREWSETMTAFQSGDPSVIEKWGKENPDGMTKLFPSVMKWLNEHNPGAYSGELGKVMKSTLLHENERGMSAVKAFNALYNIEGIDKIPGAKDLLNSISETFNDIWDAAKMGAAPGKGADPNDKRAQDLQKKERTLHVQELNSKSSPLINSAVDQAIKVAFKGITISPDVTKELRARISKEFYAIQLKDEVFQKNAKALLDPKDHDRFLKVLKSAIGRNMPLAAKREARMYKGVGGNTAQRKAEGATRVESGGGTQPQGDRLRYVGAMKFGGPDPSVIDYSAMRAKYGRAGTDERLANHEFIQKGKGDKIYFW
jgi:hypothetical protein